MLVMLVALAGVILLMRRRTTSLWMRFCASWPCTSSARRVVDRLVLMLPSRSARQGLAPRRARVKAKRGQLETRKTRKRELEHRATVPDPAHTCTLQR